MAPLNRCAQARLQPQDPSVILVTCQFFQFIAQMSCGLVQLGTFQLWFLEICVLLLRSFAALCGHSQHSVVSAILIKPPFKPIKYNLLII